MNALPGYDEWLERPYQDYYNQQEENTRTYCFTYTFVGHGTNEEEAQRDAADSAGLYELADQEPDRWDELGNNAYSFTWKFVGKGIDEAAALQDAADAAGMYHMANIEPTGTTRI